MKLRAVQTYISYAVQAYPDIDEIWHLPSLGPDVQLVVVSNRFAGSEHPKTVERLYGLLWTMPRPVPSVILHVYDHEEWKGGRGEDVRHNGTLLYRK